jgi:hypothetical protein
MAMDPARLTEPNYHIKPEVAEVVMKTIGYVPGKQMFHVDNVDKARVITQFCEEIMAGQLPDVTPAWVEFWFDSVGIPRSQRLLAYATIFPQKALLSVVWFWRSYHGPR